MGNFFAELKRRHIYRVAAAYAVVAWVLLQLVNNLTPALNLPNWAVTLVVVLLAVGFPVALLFCWIQQIGPTDGAAPSAKATRLDFVLAGALVLVIVLVSYQQGFSTRGVPDTADAIPVEGISIAVLPFANMSGDAGQEFFSDGMTEEISAALAKVPNLRLVGRTSAFQFKGQNKDFAAIRQALGAAYLIDGSVRKIGNRVRITAQLVKADDGIGLWTENYDRELTDVFVIQEDIARAIAGALRVPLGLPQGGQLVANRTGDLDSYQQFLRARSLFRARSLGDASMLLQSVVASDPGYAPAWALLAMAEILLANRNPVWRSGSVDAVRAMYFAARDKGEIAAREAMRLDPDYAGALAAQALVEGSYLRLASADDLFRRAVARDPSDPDILDRYSQHLRNVGRLRESLQLREQLRELEPSVPIYNIWTAQILYMNAQNEDAIALLEATPDVADEVGHLVRSLTFAYAHSELGRYGQAADALLAIRSSLVERQMVEDAARILRAAPARPQTLPVLERGLESVLAYVGAPERMLETMAREFQISGFIRIPPVSRAYAPLRKSDSFKAFARASGLVDYWRARGWADFCRPVGAGDFECD